MRIFSKIITLLSVCIAGTSHAFDNISLPWPLEETYRKDLGATSYLLPIAPLSSTKNSFMVVDGEVERVAFKINSRASTIELTNAWLNFLQSEGYNQIIHCHNRECGGFQFRKKLELIPASYLYIDLRNFHFVSTYNFDNQTSYVSLLVSRSAIAGYVQMDIIRNANKLYQSKKTSNLKTVFETSETLIQKLKKEGRVVLDSLEFASGSPDLEPKQYQQLSELATYLIQNPNLQILLVGHTDSKGSRNNNFDLSKKRANSVASLLVETYGIESERIVAEGIGFLAPIATNTTADGRQLNRRVEAVLISD